MVTLWAFQAVPEYCAGKEKELWRPLRTEKSCQNWALYKERESLMGLKGDLSSEQNQPKWDIATKQSRSSIFARRFSAKVLAKSHPVHPVRWELTADSPPCCEWPCTAPPRHSLVVQFPWDSVYPTWDFLSPNWKCQLPGCLPLLLWLRRRLVWDPRLGEAELEKQLSLKLNGNQQTFTSRNPGYELQERCYTVNPFTSSAWGRFLEAGCSRNFYLHDLTYDFPQLGHPKATMFISHLQWQGHGSVQGSRKTKKTPLWPRALFYSFLLFCTSRQEPHSRKNTGWTTLFVWNPPDRRLWFSQAVMSTHPVSPGRGPVGRFVHNQGFPGLHQELSHCPFITLKPSFWCIVLWASKAALGFCERPGRFPLSAATGVKILGLASRCLGKCSPPQHREQCENSEHSPPSHNICPGS